MQELDKVLACPIVAGDPAVIAAKAHLAAAIAAHNAAQGTGSPALLK